MPPFLPPELFEAIVNESAAAQDSLSEIMLVSRCFRVLALRHQFKECFIHVDDDGELDESTNITRFTELDRVQALGEIITSPLWPAEESVAYYIQGLGVKFEAYQGAMKIRDSLVSIFNALFRNQSLVDCALVITGGDYWAYNLSRLAEIFPEVAEALNMACVRPNLSRLSICDIRNIPRSFCSSSYISELCLFNSSFRSAELEDASPSPDSSDGRLPLANLRSLTYSCADGMTETIITKHGQVPHLASLTYFCAPIEYKNLFADFHQFSGPALTTLTLYLFHVIHVASETDTLQYDLLPQLSSLTIQVKTQWNVYYPPTYPRSLFACITQFLPPRPNNRKLEISLSIFGSIRFGHEDVHQAWLKFYHTFGEMELVHYWENFYHLSMVDNIEPSLIVCLPLFQDAYFMSLFNRLPNTKGVTLRTTLCNGIQGDYYVNNFIPIAPK